MLFFAIIPQGCPYRKLHLEGNAVVLKDEMVGWGNEQRLRETKVKAVEEILDRTRDGGAESMQTSKA